ncbi:MAG: 6-phosphogluconolactonase [Aestuariibacter sp.]
MKQTEFTSTDELNEAFAQTIADILLEAVEKRGTASILVSGGRTPVALFKTLSKAPLDWRKINVSLADERWVAADHEASNEKLVRDNLLQNRAAVANFISLTTSDNDANDAVSEITERFSKVHKPFDVLILGMGEDGHTASLFPCSAEINEGLNSDAEFIAVQPTSAPHQRMSFTLKGLLNSQNIFLHLTGDRKKAVLEQALAGQDPTEMPIRAVLQNANVELVWAP